MTRGSMTQGSPLNSRREIITWPVGRLAHGTGTSVRMSASHIPSPSPESNTHSSASRPQTSKATELMGSFRPPSITLRILSRVTHLPRRPPARSGRITSKTSISGLLSRKFSRCSLCSAIASHPRLGVIILLPGKHHFRGNSQFPTVCHTIKQRWLHLRHNTSG